MSAPHVVVVGAGAGGLAAAIDLARRGIAVTVLEKEAEAGGKLHQRHPGGVAVDAGPTVFTLRWVFDELFEHAGKRLDEALTLRPATRLARHAWRGGKSLDLYADVEQSVDAIGAFAGPQDAKAYRAFSAESAALFALLREPFVVNQRPSQLDVVRRVGLLNMPAFLVQIKPLRTLWSELHRRFRSPHLRQLFARYATYVGSSPYQTPATIMIVAHVEQEGVWAVEGGMIALARALQGLAEQVGAQFRFEAPVKQIVTADGRAIAVELASGERISADAVVFNGDVAALGTGLLGDDVRPGGRATKRSARSLSAVTFCANTPTAGFPLDYHNVFFGDDYKDEFDAVFRRRTITDDPTVYVCAQDRVASAPALGEPERLLFLVNAPADGDLEPSGQQLLARAQAGASKLLADCGLSVSLDGPDVVPTTPADFAARFPASGGALYGQTVHGALATLARAGARTKVPGLYMAGGSVHPGPGVPMATLSGRLAADAVMADIERHG